MEVPGMRRLCVATALGLAAGVAALPASAQRETLREGPPTTEPRPDGDRSPSAPPSTQPGPERERTPGIPPSRELRPDADERRSERPLASESQRCASYFRSLDKDRDGTLTARELDRFETVVNDVDSNRDGKISSAEYHSACVSGILRDKDIKS
jgi:hypothetical protein